jgi:hypothetical protein
MGSAAIIIVMTTKVASRRITPCLASQVNGRWDDVAKA